MAWPHVFTALSTWPASYLDDNFNAAAQSGTDVTFSGIDNTPIGATTPAAGKFTTLSATSGVSGVPSVAGNAAVYAADNGLVASPLQTTRTTAGDYHWTATNNSAAEGAANFAGFFNGVSVVGGIAPNGTTGVTYNTTSDAALKAIHGPADGSILSAIPIHDASFTTEPTARRPMVMAQELAAVAPWAVTEGDGTPERPCMVDHGALVPLLISALQGALARIAALEAKAAIVVPQTPTLAAAMTAVAAATASPVVQAALARGAASGGGHAVA